MNLLGIISIFFITSFVDARYLNERNCFRAGTQMRCINLNIIPTFPTAAVEGVTSLDLRLCRFSSIARLTELEKWANLRRVDLREQNGPFNCAEKKVYRFRVLTDCAYLTTMEHTTTGKATSTTLPTVKTSSETVSNPTDTTSDLSVTWSPTTTSVNMPRITSSTKRPFTQPTSTTTTTTIKASSTTTARKPRKHPSISTGTDVSLMTNSVTSTAEKTTTSATSSPTVTVSKSTKHLTSPPPPTRMRPTSETRLILTTLETTTSSKRMFTTTRSSLYSSSTELPTKPSIATPTKRATKPRPRRRTTLPNHGTSTHQRPRTLTPMTIKVNTTSTTISPSTNQPKLGLLSLILIIVVIVLVLFSLIQTIFILDRRLRKRDWIGLKSQVVKKFKRSDDSESSSDDNQSIELFNIQTALGGNDEDEVIELRSRRVSRLPKPKENGKTEKTHQSTKTWNYG